MRSLLLTLLLFPALASQAQTDTAARKAAPREVRTLPAQRTATPPRIDGLPDEAEWAAAQPATAFVEFRPTPGKVEETATGTTVWLLYDNTSIYVGGICRERTKDSVSRELIGRDMVGVNDFVGVVFDTYLDRINGVGFYVTPYGEQYDAKYSNSGQEDGSWNAVWMSAARITDSGWTFEMRIPYSALRFTDKEVQDWGLNITRRRTKTGQQFTWNTLDVTINGFINQEGVWSGLTKIESPIRLSFSPYFSTYLNNYPYNTAGVKNTTTAVNGGMDVKYGISESFTLDMTLIPDFGQVQSDNQVLNLSPFEVRYNENRSFFTEGTELFSKGDLFYSRRIGATPYHAGALYDPRRPDFVRPGERVLRNPTESKLMNATKVSGRTRQGLGIGFFNALTKPMYAEVEGLDKAVRRIETGTLTNYNIVVLDQNLKNNSSVSFINTNVMRSGSDPDANVTSAMFNLNNKKNIYNWNGQFSVSNRALGRGTTGYSHEVGFGKTGGRFNFSVQQELFDAKFDKNDLGIMFQNNYLEHYLYAGYRWVKPGKLFNQARINFNGTYQNRFQPSDYQMAFLNVNGNVQFKNLWWVGAFVGYNARGNDFYEPRAAGRVFISPAAPRIAAWLETNDAKKYSVDLNLFGFTVPKFGTRGLEVYYSHRYRFSDKFSLTQDLMLNPSTNGVGFYGRHFDAGGNQDGILFSKRDRKTVENVINAKYNFNNRSGITVRTRHYWSQVRQRELLDLQDNGTVVPTKWTTEVPRHQNFNAFTVDAVYTLQFAPGSFINVVWKNQIYASDDAVDYDYFKNVDRTLAGPQNNSLSLKVLYFLDVLDLKKKRKS